MVVTMMTQKRGKPSHNVMGYGNNVSSDNAKPWLDELNSERGDCGPFSASVR